MSHVHCLLGSDPLIEVFDEQVSQQLLELDVELGAYQFFLHVLVALLEKHYQVFVRLPMQGVTHLYQLYQNQTDRPHVT